MSAVAPFAGLVLIYLGTRTGRDIWDERRVRDYWIGLMIAAMAVIASGICMVLLPPKQATRGMLICLAMMFVGIAITWMINRGPWGRHDA